MIPIGLPNIDKLFPVHTEADRVRAVFQLLFYVRLRMKENPDYAAAISRESGYTPIQATKIKAIAGKKYRSKIISPMIEYGFIQIRKNEETGKEAFVPNKFTLLYRTTPKLKIKDFAGRSYRIERITNKDVIRAVKRNYDRVYETQLNNIKSKGKVYYDIIKYGEEFCIDMQQLQQDIQSGLLIDNNSLLGRALKINDELGRWCHVCSFGNRLHSYLGNMPKQLRHYLILKNKPNEPLIMADLKSSQPFFLSILFHKPSLISLIPEFDPIKKVLIKNSTTTNIQMFYQHCAAGNFYNHCLPFLTDNPKLKMNDEVKDQLKVALFQHIFYSANGNYHKDEQLREERFKLESRFKIIYPEVLQNLKSLKTTKKETLPFVYELTKKGLKRGKMFSTGSCLAQRFESKVIHAMAANFFEMGVPVFTIHDAFIFEKRHIDLFWSILNVTFSQTLKVKPPDVHLVDINPVQQ